MENKIKYLRALNNMTQEELAEKAKCTRQTINSIEKNKYSPSLDLAFKISDIFNVPITDVFVYESKK